MKSITLFCLTFAVGLACGSFAGEMPRLSDGHDGMVYGGNSAAAGASRDTVYLIGPWGSGAACNGQFQDPGGAPDWNGWTSVDLTADSGPIWHVDTYNAVDGLYSAWCGEIAYDSCDPSDPVGGYGSHYDERLVWTGIVADPGASTPVTITAMVNHDTEPGHDFSRLGFVKAGQEIDYQWTADGKGEHVPVSAETVYQPGEYVGDNADEVQIVWHVTSDDGNDDSDCGYWSNGALQVDNVTVTVEDGTKNAVYTEDFESGTLGSWSVSFASAAGDYAHVLSGLDDADRFRSNSSFQACFVADEDMLIGRGLPKYAGTSWTYGPNGYIVHPEGGASGGATPLHNEIWSPVLAWSDPALSGISFEFNVYVHEDLTDDSPGMFYTWGVKSAVANNLAFSTAPFRDRNFVYYGGPEYRRDSYDVTDLMVPGRNWVQASLGVYHLGMIWGRTGTDGTPAPYFDNVALKIYDHYGPALSAREVDLAQDDFPADGMIHVTSEMNRNDVRFDMANNVSPAEHEYNNPGDSVVVRIAAVRTGSALVTTDVNQAVAAPRLYFTIKLNPAFDASVRMGVGQFVVNAGTDGELSGAITSNTGDLMEGYVTGDYAVSYGVSNPDYWMFDLPDCRKRGLKDVVDPYLGFLYPGDVLQYYIEAWDAVGGDYQNATLPADLAGYGDFSDPLAYDSNFIVHALPTLFDDTGAQPPILFWNDYADGGGQDEWHGALRNVGFFPGVDYDIYYTNSPSSGAGNGLGGRAQIGQLYGYTTLLYTCGDLGNFTITPLEYNLDAGDDIGILVDWLNQGSKNLFASGDDLVSDLNRSGAATTAFVANWMGVNLVAADTYPLLGEAAPKVNAVSGDMSWIAFGGYPSLNTFDAVTVAGGQRLAVFENDPYGLSAETKFVAGNGSEVLSIPYDFMYVWSLNKSGQPAGLAVRTELLADILADFGHPRRDEYGVGVPDAAARFTASASPNPFNPFVKIEYTMPKPGHLSLKIFDVRGRLVRTLVDEFRETSGFVKWDGSNDQGGQVASGVYFYEAATNGQALTDKIVLLK